MRFISIISALAAVTSLAAAAAHPPLLQTRETCSTPSGSGTCQSTGSCGTFSVAGYCSGGSDNQCCVSKTCSAPAGSGTCKSTSKSCSGSFVSGYCPGSSSVQCCVASSSTSCSTPSGSGTCKSTSSCSGFSLAGYCPGGSDNQCCISKTCSTSSGSGTCKNTSAGCSGGSFIAGACPGSSSVQCCVSGATPPPSGGGGTLPGLNAKQSEYAHAIMDETNRRGLGKQGCLAALATAYTESSLRMYANNAVPASLNYPHDAIGSDHDSIGLFQQRAVYYPDIAADMDAAKSAGQFFAKMVTISGWQTMDVGTLCQKVQVSAVPDAYNQRGLPVAKPVCAAGGF